jgi:small subunit ribosomal protein S5
MVQSGQVLSLDDVFTQGLRVMEPEIVDVLLPGLKQEVLGIGFVQKQTDAGEKSRFRAVVAVGNNNGYLGVGDGKAKQVRTGIDKATLQAKLKIIPVRRGCGSWECGCGEPHSIPFKVVGKCGSVSIELQPSPRGLGIVAGDVAKTILTFAGIKGFELSLVF